MTQPSVTLVNGNTVGEAELFAGVLQDFGKTRLVGTSTEGKAVAQEYVTIQSDKGAVRLSIGLFSRIRSGSSWKDSGLIPDLMVDLPHDLAMRFELLTDKEDKQLQAGITLLVPNVNGEETPPAATPAQ